MPWSRTKVFITKKWCIVLTLNYLDKEQLFFDQIFWSTVVWGEVAAPVAYVFNHGGWENETGKTLHEKGSPYTITHAIPSVFSFYGCRDL